MSRALVIHTEDLDATPAAWLGERCDLIACAPGEDRFERLLGRADGLIVRTYTRVDAALLDRGSRLRVVARAGAGIDNIDVPACRARGIEVVYRPDANAQAVAEFVGAILLSNLRPIATLDRALPREQWITLRREQIVPRQADELTLGIWGLGRVGTRVARLGAGLGMRVIYTDLLEIPEGARHGGEPVDRLRLLRESDVLSIHVDGRVDNRGLLDAAALELVRPEVLILNTSRGFVVDASALAAFLREHAGACAWLDVHEPEPFDAGYPLLGLPGAHLSAHVASATAAAKREMCWVVKDVWRVLGGETPEFPAPDSPGCRTLG